MKKFRAFVKMVSYLTYDIEAEDEDDAYCIYENTDGGLFTEYDSSWDLTSIEEIQEA